MDRVSTFRAGSATAAFIAAAFVISSCGGPPPPPEHPTFERVAVNQRAIGIPYGAVVLFKAEDQLIALRVIDAPLWGFAIEYEWTAAPVGTGIFETSATGAGQTDEKQRHGGVKAGPLFMKWSRGSDQSGWLYWPEDPKSMAVCSMTFRSIASIDLQHPQIFWYTREMFE
jgi:hypothetical protein